MGVLFLLIFSEMCETIQFRKLIIKEISLPLDIILYSFESIELIEQNS